MSWNHRDRPFAVAIALQPTPGQFVMPALDATGLLGVSTPNNANTAVTAPDPTATGTIWDAPRIFMGKSGTGGGTIPMRGPGGTAPPDANAWPVGLIMQACGFAEIRRAAPSAATALGAGSSTTAMVLANTESATDDFLIGQAVQNAQIGTGFRQTTLIQDYVGATKTAMLAETLGGAPTGTYLFPAQLTYLLGTLNQPPPLFSLVVWRDKKIYRYSDCAITTWGFDMPVGNEQNQSFPALDFAMKGTPLPPIDGTTPALPQEILNVPVPTARGGKFFLDRIKLGHTGAKMNIGLTTGAASNQNQDSGQDNQDILSGNRNLDLTLNQMNVSDFDLDARENNQTIMPYLSTWGGGSGNNFGFLLPGLVIDPLNPQSGNGYVTLSGNAIPIQNDKSVAISVWW